MSGKKSVLNAELRTGLGKGAAKKMRRDGIVPAAVYGHGEAATHVCFTEKDWKTVLKGGTNLFDIKIGKDASKAVLVKEVQTHFLTRHTVHVDFQEVKADELINSTVKIIPTGTPVGLSQGGFLEQQMHDINVSCLPADLPDSIEVDISELDLEDILHIRDLTMPEGVTATDDLSISVFHLGKQAAAASEDSDEDELEEGAEAAVEATPEG
jgi:large subunit ribosomal protein L25